jgi:hypothetical protein
MRGHYLVFDKAIVTAARNGFRLDRAFASERASMMYAELGDELWCNDYFRKAKDAYEELEAFGKVDEMGDDPAEKSSKSCCRFWWTRRKFRLF